MTEMHIKQHLDYQFSDVDLLYTALTHKSFTNERPAERQEHNERLEFLGDAVLELVVSRYLFTHYPDLAEGEMTRLRAEVVSEPSLAVLARNLSLGERLYLGKGEELSGGREKDSLLANAFEALLGAIFVDGGFDPACRVGEKLLVPLLVAARKSKSGSDHKTQLQELMQARYGHPPAYILKGVEGPDHQRIFSIVVMNDDAIIGRGSGRSKKAAEQEAARQALLTLEP